MPRTDISLDAVRDFTGNPNPTPTPPAGPAPRITEEKPVVQEDRTGEIARPTPAESGKAPASYTASLGADGTTWEIVRSVPGEVSKVVGSSSLPGLENNLKAIGTYNAGLREYSISEKYANELISGRPGMPEWLAQRFKAGEAGVISNLTYARALRGEISWEDAKASADKNALQAQIGAAPELAWKNVAGGAINQTIKAAGDVAEMLPGLKAYTGKSASTAAIFGGGALAASWVTLGTAGMAAPAVAAGIAGVMTTGASYGLFKAGFDMGAGEVAQTLYDKGVDPNAIKKVAPMAGVINGALDMWGISLLSAPFKRAVARNILTSAPVKAALTKWYTQYAMETAGEVAVEDVQELVSATAENIAADIDNKPDAYNNREAITKRIMDTTIKSVRAFAVMKAPGAALDFAGERGAKAKAAQATAEMDAKVASYESKTAEVRQAVEAATPEEAPALPAGIEETLSAKAEALAKAAAAGEKEPQSFTEELSAMVEEQEAAEAKAMGVKAQTTDLGAAEIKGVVATLDSQLSSVRESIDLLIKTRKQMISEEVSTDAIDKRLQGLMDRENALDSHLAYYLTAEEDLKISKGEKLTVKAADLERLLSQGHEAGYVEGRKTVIKERAEAIKTITDEFGLTPSDTRKILGGKNVLLMGDVMFRNWLNEGHERTDKETGTTRHIASFRELAAAAAERKNALRELQAMRHEKELKGEQHIRALNELPPIHKMTTEQIKQYTDILGKYAAGDVAMTPKRIKALEGSKFSGAKTWGDIKVRMGEVLAGAVEETRGKFKAPWYTPVLDATRLSHLNKLFKYSTETLEGAMVRAGAITEAYYEKFYPLAAKALASRKRGLLGHLVPQMKEVFDYIEAENKEEAATRLTPEELEFVRFMEEGHQKAEEYLVANGDMASSRFTGGKYITHVQKGVLEILADIKDTGVKNALKDIVNTLVHEETQSIDLLAPKEKNVGFTKFFKNVLFRSGELTPSKNVIKVHAEYMKQFFKKRALDESVGEVLTVAEAAKHLDKLAAEDEAVKAVYKSWDEALKIYVDAKKGNARIFIPQSSMVAAGLRHLNSLVSFMYIGGNYILQAASPVGETTAMGVLLGPKKFAEANRRRLTAQGRKIINEHPEIVGTPWRDIVRPGQDIADHISSAAYGVFSLNRRNTMETILLGGLTKEEFESGKVSPERLAEIKIEAGRWLDIPGLESPAGITPEGSTFKKFRGWAYPILATTLEDLNALKNSVTGKESMTPQQKMELVRIGVVASFGVLARSLSKEYEDDDSAIGVAIKRVVNELNSVLQAIKPSMFLSVGASLGFVTNLAKNIELLLTLEEYKTKEGLVGADRLKRQFTPSFARGALGGGEKPKRRPGELW